MNKILLLDAAKRVDKTNPQYVSLDELQAEFNIHEFREYDQELDDRFKEYFIIKWYCTDAWVGLSAIYLDDELIATCMQEGRKCGKDFEFVSIEAAKKVYDLLRPQFNPNSVSIVGKHQTIDDYYTVEFGSQLLVEEGFYKGEKVTVVEKYQSYQAIDLWRSLVIRRQGGQCETINISDFHIPIHVTEQK